MSERETVVVVDFGGQYAQLIARRVRALGVYCELVNATAGAQEALGHNPSALILSGGPASVYEPGAPPLDRQLLTLGVPVLGICYGMQAMAQELGGEVARAHAGEFGVTTVEIAGGGMLLRSVGEGSHPCLMSHRDAVVKAPEGFSTLAFTDACPVAAMEDPERRLYAVQFHPETVHTPFGDELLRNFLFGASRLTGGWSAASIVEEQVARIRAQVGEERVICGLSGGVDSSVAALLVHRAVGEQLTCVFVDHGMLREGEAAQVVRAFREQFDVPLVHVDARERFLSRLRGVTEPERKRRIIGEQFIRVFEEQARALRDAAFLVQGTLYSDVIESGGAKGAATIKSHHNVGGLPDDLSFELVEPLRLLFKDEVRAVGKELGLPERFVWRQPFPGPGLAIRIIGGEVNEERLQMLRSADSVLQEEIRAAGLYGELWQSFCVLQAGVRSVGVQGDERTYGHPVVVRAVTSDDAMTAEWARLPYDLLARVSARIVNEVPGVNRVTLDITAKPPGTIEWE